MGILKLSEESALVQAVFNGEPDEVRSLLYKHEDVNYQDPEKRSPLHAAAFCGESLISELLLGAGARVNIKDNKWLTPLHRACAVKAQDVVKVLLEHDADVNARDKNWQTPLHVASANGALLCADLLLPRLTNINVSDRAGHTALHHAVFNGHLQMMNLLLVKGASVNAFDKKDRRAMHWAAAKGQNEIVNLLVEHSAEVNCRDKNMFTPLHCATSLGHLAVVRKLIELGAELDAVTVQGNTPLHIACLNGTEEVADELLSQMTQETRLLALNAANQQGKTPLHLAASSCEGEACMDLLLAEGAQVGVSGHDGRTPLHMAAIHGRFSRAVTLLKHGAEVNSRDKANNTPLHIAAQRGHDLFVTCMLEHGAEWTLPGEGGLLPLHMAALYGYETCVKKLLEWHRPEESSVEKEIEHQDQWSRTAVHAAAAGGSLDCLKMILGWGGKIHIPDREGRTPLHLAAAHSHTNIVKDLLRSGADPNCRDSRGCYPLHYAAAFNRDANLIQFLISYKANACLPSDEIITWKESFVLSVPPTKEVFYPLHFAAFNGNSSGVDLLLNSMPGDLVRDLLLTQGTTPLHLAAYHGHEDTMALLIDQWPDAANVTDLLGRTPLHLAAFRGGGTRGVMVLLDHGAQVTAHDNVYRWNPVHYAAAQGHTDTMRALLFDPSLVDSLDEHKRTPLMLAVQNGHIDTALFLIKAGANINRADIYGRTSLHRAAANGHEECVVTLIQSGANTSARDFRGRNALHMAATCDHVNTLSKVLDATYVHPLPNISDKHGYTPLHFAAFNGNDTCVEMLLENKDHREFKGNPFTPLHCAVINGNDTCTELLLEAQTTPLTVNSPDARQRTPCHAAAFTDQSASLTLLLRYGADLNTVDFLGRTPIMMAARHNRTACLDVILNQSKCPVDLTRADHSGMTVLHHACQARDDSPALLLLERIDDVDMINQADSLKRTPAHLAAAGGLPNVLENLITKGANLFAPDAQGHIPALSCAPTAQVAECLSLCLAAMFPDFSGPTPPPESREGGDACPSPGPLAGASNTGGCGDAVKTEGMDNVKDELDKSKEKQEEQGANGDCTAESVQCLDSEFY